MAASSKTVAALTVGLFIVGVISAIASVLQWSVIKDQLAEMRSDGRAWVGPPKVEVLADENTRFRFTFGNTGKSPTVMLYADAVIVEAAEINAEADKLCAAGKKAASNSPAIFPGGVYIAYALPSAEFDFSTPTRVEGMVEPRLAGCIVYKIATQDDFKSTRFAAPMHTVAGKVYVGPIETLGAD